MLGGADNSNGELPSYIIGANNSDHCGISWSFCTECPRGLSRHKEQPVSVQGTAASHYPAHEARASTGKNHHALYAASAASASALYP